jgi:hypothetical protein
VSLNRTVSAAAVIGLSVIHIRASTTQTRSRIAVARNASHLLPRELPFLFFLLKPEKESGRENMRSPDPSHPALPSITFILSQVQPALTTRGSTRRRGKFGVRRSKSSPSFGAPYGPHPPRYPPQLGSDFLEVREFLSITAPSSGADRRIASINCWREKDGRLPVFQLATSCTISFKFCPGM